MKGFLVTTANPQLSAYDVRYALSSLLPVTAAKIEVEEIELPEKREPYAPWDNEAVTAHEFLDRAGVLLGQRGREYDKDAERSGGKIAQAFTAITGIEIGASEVYLLLQIVKDVRQWTAKDFHRDSAEDSVAYAALKSEALADE